MIAKSTNVIVRRVPVKAQRRRFDNSTSSAPAPTGRSNISMGNSTPSISSSTSLMPLLAGGVSENDRIEALVSQGPGWSQGQAVPQQARFLQNSSKTPPPHYVCHRCQQGGHWISACPTNGDTAFDFRRIKKVSCFTLLIFNNEICSFPRNQIFLIHCPPIHSIFFFFHFCFCGLGDRDSKVLFGNCVRVGCW